jgi:hypothetical protein
LIIAALVSGMACAKDYYVSTTGSGARTGGDWQNTFDNLSFASALNTALSGDVFHLAAGTYVPYFDVAGKTPAGNERTKTFLIREGVSIRGGYDIDGKLISDADAAISAVRLSGDFAQSGSKNSNSYHVVTIADGANNPSVPMLHNLTVVEGYANGGGNNARGGGIFIGEGAGKNKAIEISRVCVSGNKSTNEGCGIFINNNAVVIITGSQILNNTRITSSDVWGGGISLERSQLNISDTKFVGNTANHGGAMHAVAGRIVSTRCTYTSNSAGTHGGAIDVYSKSFASFHSDVFANNSAPEGGGVHNESRSEIKFVGSVFNGNTASESGGGFFNSGDCTASADSCVFERNSARRGGGIDNRGEMLVTKSRIISNTASVNGGGINQHRNLTVRQSEISGNTAKSGGGLYTESNFTLMSSVTISGNIASEDGGGISHRSGKCELNYLTVTRNMAQGGKSGGIRTNAYPVIRNSIISGNSGGDFDGNNMYEFGDNSSSNNIIGADYYVQGNRSGQSVAFQAAEHLGALSFNRKSNTQTHALTWKGSSANNPATGKAQYNSQYAYDQTGFERSTKYPSLGAYEEQYFKAVNDIAYADGNVASIDILANDAYSNCTPTVTILTQSSAKASIIRYVEPYLVYMPKAGAKGADTVKYMIECPGGFKDYASVTINIGRQYDRPQNIKDEVFCMKDMPPVKFAVSRKIYNDKVWLDGFSIPLVGDLNGDGKAEIIGLGVVADGGGNVWDLDAVGKSIVIYDGQTGDVLLNFVLADLKQNKYDSNDGYGTRYGFQLRWNPRHNSYSHMAIADLDNDGIGEIVVAETGSGKVYALKPKLGYGKRILTLTELWKVKVLHKYPYTGAPYDDNSIHDFGAPVPYISDLNGDGIPEVIVYNKIYNGKTGDLVLELETLNKYSDPGRDRNSYERNKKYAYVGRLVGAEEYDDCMPAMAINDIDGDGIMEIIAGSKIYKPAISNTNSTLGNTYKVKYGPESTTVGRDTYFLTDGFTVVADIDGDDVSDVIVVKRHLNRGHLIIYVWDPRIEGNAGLKASLAVEHTPNTGHFSVPFVGDINGRTDGWNNGKFSVKLPEICLTLGMLRNNNSYPITEHRLSTLPPYTSGTYTGNEAGQVFRGHVAAFTYDVLEPDVSKRLKLSWLMKHSDVSHQTGIVMFDFDADGVNELVYRDEISLRVIAPANKADGYDFVNLTMNNVSHPSVIRFRETGIASYTGFECPVIADVNGDGSADIITFAIKLRPNERTGNSGGHLFVYEAAGESWAPSRPVWNQGIYYPLQINDNLTVPRRPQSTLTKYYSKLPNQAKGDTIRPFNGNWIQQPIVRKSNYVPIMMMPDLALVPDSFRIISSSATETVIKIAVENRGEASANSTTPISFYHSSIASNNRIVASSPVTGRDIYVGETVTLTCTLYGDQRGKIIYARVVDRGGTFPATGYADCDPSNNTASTMQVTAVDDYFAATVNSPAYINVTKNDIYNSSLIPQIEIRESARNGISLVAGTQISYIANPGFQGIDTIRYRIQCTYNNITTSDEATVYVLVLKPSSREYSACPGAVVTLEMNPVAGVQYDWYDAETAGKVLAGGKGKNSIQYKKGATDETLWVQANVPKFPVNAFPRYRVGLTTASGCGSDTPSGCMVNGSLLFQEDFGGNLSSDKDVSDNGTPRVIDYVYSTQYADNSYTLRKQSGGQSNWFDNISDHTYPADILHGYMAQFNATGVAGKVYEYLLNDLCEGSKLYFSAWIANVSKTSMPDKANMIFSVEDLNGNVIARYYTGNIDDGGNAWKNYGFAFTVPPRVSSAVFKIANNAAGGNGNNFAMDDVMIHLCVPEAVLSDDGNHALCEGTSHDFTGKYTDDGSFGNDLTYRFQYRKDKSAAWQTFDEGKTANPVEATKRTEVKASGYYRFVVGRSEVIDCDNCIALSNEIYMAAKNCTSRPVYDYVVVPQGESATVKVLANDNLICNSSVKITMFDTIAGSGLHLGSLVKNADSTLTYTARNGVSGIDSVKYLVVCEAAKDTGRIYILVNKPVPLHYACQGSGVKIGFGREPDVAYEWYDNMVKGNLVAGTVNDSLSVVKGSDADAGRWWIQPVWKGMKFPRFAIDLLQADNCGTTVPAGCLADGTTLFREDFGGNSSGDPNVKLSGIAGVTGYEYVGSEDAAKMTDNTYSVRKLSAASANRTAIGDHSSPTDAAAGYLAQFGVSGAAGQFYSTRIDGLCEDSELLFSAWITGVSNTAGANPSRMIFLIEDTAANVRASFTALVPDGDVKWKNYGFKFAVPKGCSSLILKIVNNTAGSNGFVIDDVEMRLCTPKIKIADIAGDTVVCYNSKLAINASYPDAGNPFGNSIACRWEFRHIDSVKWRTLDEQNVTAPFSVSWKIDSTGKNNDGYYRLLAGKGNVDARNCCAMSDSVRVRVLGKVVAPDIRIQASPAPDRVIRLASFVDSVDHSTVKWNRVSPGAPEIIAGTDESTGSINSREFSENSTYVYKYTLSQCGSSEAKVYIHTLKDRIYRTPDTVMICQSHEASKTIYLNQILGLDLGGTWMYDNTVNPDATVSECVAQTTTPSKYAGMMIFDATKAWNSAPASYNIDYKGYDNAKIFKFVYLIPTPFHGVKEERLAIVVVNN